MLLVFCCALGLLAGCSSGPRAKATAQKPAPGGYYLDDGPGTNPPADLLAIADAVPRAEPPHRFANRPYEALGMKYIPLAESGSYSEEGTASWYGRRYHGKPTSSGENYDMYAMTAAHPILPIPSYARVTALDSGKSVIVRINDRGPFHGERLIDLSYTAAFKLGLLGRGSGRVRVESLDPARMQAAAARPGDGVAAQAGHYLQLGAFGSPDNAGKLLERARLMLGVPAAQSRVAPAGAMHRVSLGPFASETEAGDWAQKARTILGIEPVKISD